MDIRRILAALPLGWLSRRRVRWRFGHPDAPPTGSRSFGNAWMFR